MGDRDGGPGLSRSRQRQADAAGDQRSDLRRQEWEELSGSFRASREEAPEESIFSSATRLPDFLVRPGERSGTQEWSTQEGPQNTGWFWLRGTSVPDARPERSKDQRTFGPRSRVDRSGSSQEGAVRWKATPELVSQDREAGSLTGLPERDQGRSNTGISFARRSGGWQQCQPSFLMGRSRRRLRSRLVEHQCPRATFEPHTASSPRPAWSAGSTLQRLPSTNRRKPIRSLAR